MMFKKSTCKITYVGEISTQILVLPYAGQELNMVILLPSESTDLNTVTGQPWPRGPGSRLHPCWALGSGGGGNLISHEAVQLSTQVSHGHRPCST